MAVMWLLVGLTLSAQTVARPAEQTGHVVDPSGTRIAGVRIRSSPPDDDQQTDAAGSFRLVRPGDLVRFWKQGFTPRTLPRTAVSGEVVLSPARQAPWMPPTCDATAAKRFGERMQFIPPSGAQLRSGADIDYRTVSLRRGRSWLTFGTGQLWTWGLPVTQTFKEMAHVDERDVIFSPEVEAAEYRGTLRNGNRWRTITMFFESIEYYNATPSDAAYFDRIIDTLCLEPSQMKRKPAP